MTESRPLASQPVGKGRGTDCHELGEDAVVPEKPVKAALGRSSETWCSSSCLKYLGWGPGPFSSCLPPLEPPMP